jgi:hypothetical protein
MGKHFVDPKSSEILSIFQVFPYTTQIALFWPKLLPALFLKKPWYPCPFEILEETLGFLVSYLRCPLQCSDNSINPFTTNTSQCRLFYYPVKSVPWGMGFHNSKMVLAICRCGIWWTRDHRGMFAWVFSWFWLFGPQIGTQGWFRSAGGVELGLGIS